MAKSIKYPNGFPSCLDCVFYHDKDIKLNTCEAFPEGIPWLILTGNNEHKKPVKGDHGIQFKKRKEKE